MSESDAPQSWPREKSETVGEFHLFDVRCDRLRSPRNGTVQEFDIIEAPDAVTVLALTGDGRIVLVEQFRHGVREVVLETPSGMMEEGEDPIPAALRELREETGYEAEEAEVLGRITLNPAWQTTRVYVVLARGVERTGEVDLDEGEDVRVRLLPRSELPERVRDGTIHSAVVLAALALMDRAGA